MGATVGKVSGVEGGSLSADVGPLVDNDADGLSPDDLLIAEPGASAASCVDRNTIIDPITNAPPRSA
jgi:hypothetical protein